MLRYIPIRSASAVGVAAVLLAFVGLSLGSTLAKASGSPGSVVAFWRLLIAAGLWHALIALRGVRQGAPRHVDRAAWGLATLPGIAFGVNLCCFFSGVDRTPIAHAEFISALTPLVMIPLAAVTLKERIERHTVVAGAVALCGVALILSRTTGGATSYLGDLLVTASMGAWVVHLLSGRRARTRLDTLDFMAVMSTAACLTTLAISLAVAGGPGELVGLSAKGWLVVSVLAVTAGVVSHGLIAWSQRRVPLGTISMLQLVQPGLGVLWGATFLGEGVVAIQLVGMAVVLGAVGTIARRSARPVSAPEAPGSRRHPPPCAAAARADAPRPA
jgi:drug/metabolite transporter (DMT)-like permease